MLTKLIFFIHAMLSGDGVIGGDMLTNAIHGYRKTPIEPVETKDE